MGAVCLALRRIAGTKRDTGDRDEKLKAFCRRFVERAFRRPLDDSQRAMFVERHFAEVNNCTWFSGESKTPRSPALSARRGISATWLEKAAVSPSFCSSE